MDTELRNSVVDKTFGLMTGYNELIKKCENLNLARTYISTNHQQTSKSSGWVIKVASRDRKEQKRGKVSPFTKQVGTKL